MLNFGAQYAQLIARRVREQHVFCQLARHDISPSRIRELAPKGLILSGGPASVYQPGAPRCDPEIFELGVPVLGICYGMQLTCHALGGRVEGVPAREYGRTTLRLLPSATPKTQPAPSDPRPPTSDPLFAGVPQESIVWMSHGDQVQHVGDDFVPLAATATCPVAAVKHRRLLVYGLQFHPEVTHTPHGKQILANFLRQVCGCEGRWHMSSFLEETTRAVRQQVGTSRVICGLSGGVDSAVTAALLYQAIGEQLVCIFVDNGLLRLGEPELVRETFGQHFRTELHVVDAADRFLAALQGVTDPQEKRRRIGHVFIDVFEEEARRIQNVRFLAQGTLYPDVIESGAAADGPTAIIKFHHNVGGLPADLGLALIEPLRDLFKDEVRRLGEDLGLPEEIVWRHPFPGPGLAVRCVGPVTRERLLRLRRADAIVVEEIRGAGLYRQVAQAFAVLLPVQSVGVMGDDRTYAEAVAVRAVETEDFMTADWARLPADLLARISSRIINEVPGVNRVLYDISSKPPSTIEWE
ncbi:MAG: glutamine-hydrolyzing GMP synthase [Planctomycetes bacterium]|nr:glutamine-hydrolyzing GMP synthase [Planctomycetota bacterium]